MFPAAAGVPDWMDWLPPAKLPDQFTAGFKALVNYEFPFLEFPGSEPGASLVTILLSTAGTFLVFGLPAWFLYSKRKKKIDRHISKRRTTGAGKSSADLSFASLINNESIQAVANMVSDADYAEDLQFHEALLASLFTYELSQNVSSSSGGLGLDTKLAHFQTGDGNSSQNFCEICLEERETREMFRNDSCSHTFCYDCTSKHVMSKIKDRVVKVGCPEPNCTSTLDIDAFRSVIPKDALIQWEELLCQSLIPESQKLYCPFRDCSALYINDTREVIKKIKCLLCKRSFCAACRVPWHPDFTCKEFQKLYAKRQEKDDIFVKTLAKKKNWQRCPKCKMLIERIEGCLHITCRCTYEFCYRCGSKWSYTHSGCRQK